DIGPNQIGKREVSGETRSGMTVADPLPVAASRPLDAGIESPQSVLHIDPEIMTAAGLRGPVAPELVGYFASQLAGHYSADRFLGPMRLIPTALSQYEL